MISDSRRKESEKWEIEGFSEKNFLTYPNLVLPPTYRCPTDVFHIRHPDREAYSTRNHVHVQRRLRLGRFFAIAFPNLHTAPPNGQIDVGLRGQLKGGI